jgi:hypothetical protein
MFAAAGAILLLGVLLDLFALWVLQRQKTVQWEFAALGTTTNSFVVLLLSAALFYGALALGGSESLARYRMVALYAVVLGLVGLGIAFLIGTNYLAIRRDARITAEATPIFKGMFVKSAGVSVAFGVTMLVVGLRGISRPRSR